MELGPGWAAPEGASVEAPECAWQEALTLRPKTVEAPGGKNQALGSVSYSESLGLQGDPTSPS